MLIFLALSSVVLATDINGVQCSGSNLHLSWDDPTNHFIVESFSLTSDYLSCNASSQSIFTNGVSFTPDTLTRAFYRIRFGIQATVFEDQNLYQAVYNAISSKMQPTNAIYDDEAQRISTLYAGSTSISNLSGISACSQLSVLDVSESDIINWTSLNSLTNLDRVYVSNTDLLSLDILSSLTSLTWLEASRNQISNLYSIQTLTNLTELMLDENSISDISAVWNMTQLDEIVISHNMVTNIEPLSLMTNLTSLYINDNAITDLSPHH